MIKLKLLMKSMFLVCVLMLSMVGVSSASVSVTSDSKYFDISSGCFVLEGNVLVKTDTRTIGADKALAEFMGPRADDRVMELEMLDQINKNGYTELDTLTNHLENKTTLVTLDVYLLGMGIKSDLITNGLAINRTINKEK